MSSSGARLAPEPWADLAQGLGVAGLVIGVVVLVLCLAFRLVTRGFDQAHGRELKMFDILERSLK